MGAEPGTSPDGAGPDGRRESARAIREARLFRAALADTFDAIVADLVRRLAAEVVSRELRLAPVDVEGLTRRLIAEQQADEPVSLRVSPADAHISCELPLVADASLQPGDAVLICRSGEVDARLAVRLANVLNAVTW
jgi:flagellar biosynthesis/type III secretory pathway protein FliH